jgi:hypothetical protein
MPARSSVAITVLAVIVAGCGSVPSAGSPAAGSPTSSAAPSRPAAATRSSPSTKPSPTTRVGVFPNPDGSVLVGLPAAFGFAQPGDSGIWGILQYPGVGRDVVRIDPETYAFEAVVKGLPILPDPVAPVVVNGSIWLVDDVAGSVTQYDAEAGARIREIEVGRFPIEPVAAYGDVWTINHHGDSITRIDSETGEPYPAIELPGSRPLTITVVADDLMLVNGPDGSPTTWMVDPQRMELIGTFESTGCLKHYGYMGVAIGGVVWRQNCDATAVTIIDPRTGEQLGSFPSPVAPYPPLYVGADMWLPVVAGGSPGTVGLALVHPATHDVVRTYEQTAPFHEDEGWWFAAFDSWWRWGDEGLLRVPADTLREAAG